MVRIGILGVGDNTHGQAWLPLINGTAASPPQTEMRATVLWDQDPAVAQKAAAAFGAEVADTPEEMLRRQVEGVVVTDLDAGTYAALSQPFLEAGLPVFLNRPLAESATSAAAILERARAHGAPVLSASSLLFADGVRAMAEPIVACGRLRTFLSSCASGHFEWYAPHAIATLYAALGPGVELVRAWGRGEPEVPEGEVRSLVAYLQYGPQARHPLLQGNLHLLPGVKYGMYELQVWGDDGRTPVMNGAAGPRNLYLPLLLEIGKMIATRQEPVPHEELLEVVCIHYALRRSAEEGRPVRIAEML